MKEHEARRAILKRTDLSAADKVTMMAILMSMDWKTWTNRTTHSALARMTGRNRGNINKNVKRLEELGLIKRDWWTSDNRCKSPVMTVVKEALDGEQIEDKPRTDRGKSRPFPQEAEVSPQETEVFPQETKVSPQETKVFPQETGGVSLEQHISITNNQPLIKPNINPWGVPNEYLWGDVLRGDK